MAQSFNVGDIVKQTYQVRGAHRLVVALTDDPRVIAVWDPDDRRYRKVFTWGHSLVQYGDLNSVTEAIEHTLSEVYLKATSETFW